MARILDTNATQLERFDRVIDIGEQANKAVILRNGTSVYAPAVDLAKADALVDKLAPVAVTSSPRVLTQSVAIGTRVPKGTAVDLVLAAPVDIDINVILGAHDDLKQRAIADIAPVVGDPKISAILEKYDDISKASEAERAVLNNAANQLQIQLDNDPASGRSINAFFTTLQASQAFL